MAGELRLIIAGSTLSYAVESTAGTRPTTGYLKVPEVTNIPEMAAADYDEVDMTPIDESVQHQIVTGLRQSPGTLTFEANLSDDLKTFWDTLISAYATGIAASKKTWFALSVNGMTDAYYFTAEPKALAISGGSPGDGWKCNLPLTMTNTPAWYAKPTLAT